MRALPKHALLALSLAAGLAAAAPGARAASTPDAAASQPVNAVPADFAKPFNAAQDLLKANNPQGALEQLKAAAAVPNQTPYMQYLLARVRGPAEYASGDNKAAAADFETVLNSDQLPAGDRLVIMKALISAQYNAQDYGHAGTWMQKYIAEGGPDKQIPELLAQVQYLNKDYPAAARSYQKIVDATYAAGQRPTEKTLRILASAQSQANDDAGYESTIERLAVAYPKPDYWKDIVAHVSHAGGKLTDAQYVDIYRLKLAALGDLSGGERLSYAQLANHAGFPAEARRVLDEGKAKNAFTGADAAEANKLLAQVGKAAAQDRAQAAANQASARNAPNGNALVGLGLLDAYDNDPAQGAALIQQGIDKGGLKSPDEARLHLGIAQFQAGHYDEALKSFQAVPAGGGVGSLAHGWMLLAQSKLPQPQVAAK